MTETRRDFLKFVVAGSVAAGCPVNHLLLAAESGPKAQVDGDHFAICHEVRDGQQFDKPAVSSRHDVVVVGGGVSGMSAAYFLRGRDFLLLEKEPHWGGNAYLEEYQGQAFAVGSAFDEKDSASEKLAREIGLIELADQFPGSHDRRGKVGAGHMARRIGSASLLRSRARKLQEIPHGDEGAGSREKRATAGQRAAHELSEGPRAGNQAMVGRVRPVQLGRESPRTPPRWSQLVICRT